jgi:uncharacterized protein YutE (UPF0331/DUF86 family)
MSIDADVLILRLGLMRELLADLESVGEVDARRLRNDRLTRHAVERILTQLVDLAVSINSHVAASAGKTPSNYRESFHAAAAAGLINVDLAQRLAPSAGLRNVLTHDYVDIDLGLVAGAVTAARRDYGEYVTAVARTLR